MRKTLTVTLVVLVAVFVFCAEAALANPTGSYTLVQDSGGNSALAAILMLGIGAFAIHEMRDHDRDRHWRHDRWYYDDYRRWERPRHYNRRPIFNRTWREHRRPAVRPHRGRR